MVETGWQDFSALGVEQSLGDLGLVALEDFQALESCYVIHTTCGINRCCHQGRPDGIKIKIKDFIFMSFENSHTFPSADIPKPASFIYRWSPTNIPTKLKLCRGDLTTMPSQHMNRLTLPSIPQYGSTVKRTSQYLITIGIEIQGYNLTLVSLECG